MMMVGLVDKGADKFQRFRHNHEQRVVALVVGAIGETGARWYTGQDGFFFKLGA